MKISAMEEYGLRCLLQLARATAGQLMSAEAIAAKEGLSMAYVEKILAQLRKVGLVKSVRGLHGGYQLTRPPEQIPVGEILRTIDGDFFTDLCHNFSGNRQECTHIHGCSLRPIWLTIARHVYRILDSLTLRDLIEKENSVEKQLFGQFALMRMEPDSMKCSKEVMAK